MCKTIRNPSHNRISNILLFASPLNIIIILNFYFSFILEMYIVHTILLYWLACLVKSKYVFEKHVSGKWCHRTFSRIRFSLLFPRRDQNTLKEKRFIGLRFIYVDNDV